LLPTQCERSGLSAQVVEEAIALLQARKLVADQAEERLAHEGAVEAGVLEEHAHEEVDVLHVLVELLQPVDFLGLRLFIYLHFLSLFTCLEMLLLKSLKFLTLLPPLTLQISRYLNNKNELSCQLFRVTKSPDVAGDSVVSPPLHVQRHQIQLASVSVEQEVGNLQ